MAFSIRCDEGIAIGIKKFYFPREILGFRHVAWAISGAGPVVKDRRPTHSHVLILAFCGQFDKIHQSAVGKSDARHVSSVLELNCHSLGIDRKHISKNARMPKPPVIIDNPAARFDLVDGSEWSHLVSAFLR
jgi:hypothetical protein